MSLHQPLSQGDTDDRTRLVRGQEFQYSKAHTHQPTRNQKISNLDTLPHFCLFFNPQGTFLFCTVTL